MNPHDPQNLEKMFQEQDSVDKGILLQAMAEEDLRVRGVIHHYIMRGGYCQKIKPSLTMEEGFSFNLHYYRDCVLADVSDDEDILSRYEACWELNGWFKNLMQGEEPDDGFLNQIEELLRKLYREGDKEIRDAVICGSLEHMLESRKARKYFDDWHNDPELNEAFEAAMEWAVDHESE